MLERISQGIDTFNRRQGEWMSLLIIPLCVVVIYEVIMRYVFNAPTVWGFEATTFLYGIHYMFGYAYTDVLDGHVKVDVFTGRMSSRAQAVLAMVTNVVIFLPVFGCMVIWSWKFAIVSTLQGEVNSTSWAPPVYPFKIIMALCFTFLLAQGVSNLIKSINQFRASGQRA